MVQQLVERRRAAPSAVSDDVSARLDVLSQVVFKLEADIGDLANCPDERDFFRQSESLRRRLQAMELDLQTSSRLVDAEQGVAQDVVRAKQDRLDSMLKSLYSNLRKESLSFKRNAELRAQRERTVLLAGGSAATDERTKLAHASLLKTATSVTDMMRRSAQHLDNEVMKSLKAAESLDESSRTLKQVKAEYGRSEGALSTGGHVFSRLRQREFTDRILTWLGVLVFVLVVLYILKSRLWS